MKVGFKAEEFMQAMEFDKDDPHTGLANNASLLAFYGTQRALWEGQVVYTKMVVENTEAMASAKVRDEHTKISVAAADAMVANDDEVQAAKKSHALAKTQHALYTNACQALQDRGNNLRSIGTWLRSEKSFTTASIGDEHRRVLNSLGKGQ